MSSSTQVYQTNGRLLDRTRNIQEETLKSLDRTKAKLFEAEEKGNATLYKLNEHGDQIVNIELAVRISLYLRNSLF
jgi:hypothetical protein